MGTYGPKVPPESGALVVLSLNVAAPPLSVGPFGGVL
jgi:hypothetical protein